MNIVLGRGKKREVIELPCGALLAQAQKDDPKSYDLGFQVVLGLLGVTPRGG